MWLQPKTDDFKKTREKKRKLAFSSSLPHNATLFSRTASRSQVMFFRFLLCVYFISVLTEDCAAP
jgi:hypothetical protein